MNSIVSLLRDHLQIDNDAHVVAKQEDWANTITICMFRIIQYREIDRHKEVYFVEILYQFLVLGKDIELKDNGEDEQSEISNLIQNDLKNVDCHKFIANVNIRLVIVFLLFCSDIYQTEKLNEIPSYSVVCDFNNSNYSVQITAILTKLSEIYHQALEAAPTNVGGTGQKSSLIKPALHFQSVNNIYLPGVFALPNILSDRFPEIARFFMILIKIVGKSFLTALQQCDPSYLVRSIDCINFANFINNLFTLAEPGTEIELCILEILQDCITSPVFYAGFRSSPSCIVDMLCKTMENNLGKRRFVAIDILRHFCSDPFVLETLYCESLENERGETQEACSQGKDVDFTENSNRNFLIVLVDIIRQAEVFAKYRAWKTLAVIATLRIKWLEKYADIIINEVEIVLSRDGQLAEEHVYSDEDDAHEYLHELPELKQKIKKEIISLLVNIQMSDWYQRFVRYNDILLPKVVQLLRDKDSDTCSAAASWLFNCLRVSSHDYLFGEGCKNNNFAICSELQLNKLKQYFDHKTKGNNPASFYSVSFPLLFQLSDELHRINKLRVKNVSSEDSSGNTSNSSSPSTTEIEPDSNKSDFSDCNNVGAMLGSYEYSGRYRDYLFIISQKLTINNINPLISSINMNSMSFSKTSIFANPIIGISSIGAGNSDRFNGGDEKERKNAIRALCKMRLLQHCPWTIELFFDEDFALVESTLDAFQLLMNKTDPLNLLVLHGVCTLLMDILLVIENQDVFGWMVEDKFLVSRLSICGIINSLLTALTVVTFPPIVQLLLGMVGKLLKLEAFQQHLLLQGCKKVLQENIKKLAKEAIIRQVNDTKKLPFELALKKFHDEYDDADYKGLLAQATRWDYNNQITNLWTAVHLLVVVEEDGSLPSAPLHINKQNQLIDKLEYLANNFNQMPTLLEHELLITLQVFDILLSRGGQPSIYLPLMKKNCHLFARILEDLILGMPCSSGQQTKVVWWNNILLTGTIRNCMLLVMRITCQVWNNDIMITNEETKIHWKGIINQLQLIDQQYFRIQTGKCTLLQADLADFASSMKSLSERLNVT